VPVAKPVITLRLAPTVAREWGTFDALLYNLMTMNLAVMLAVPFLAAMAFYPRGSLPAAILIAGLFCCAEAAVYAFVASSMPRSGGDYYFQSRLLSPGVGTVFAFTGVVLGGALWMAIGGWFAAHVAVGPLLWALGRLTGSDGLLSVAAFVRSSHGVMLLSVAVVCWSALIDFWGLRPYAWLQRACWVVGGLALVLVIVMVLVLGPDAVGDAGPYRQAAAIASGRGFSGGAAGSGLAATLALVPVAAFSLIYPAWSVQQAGEVRQAASLRAQIVTILVAEAATVALSAATVGLLLLAVDREGLAAGGRG
jgi:amino acid transporter